MRIASALGGLAFCAAVFLFFYRFWGLPATPVQITILIAAPQAGLTWMFVVSRRERTLFNLTPSPNASAAFAIFRSA